MFNLVKWGVELKMNWSIPISSGFQFQFNSNSKSFNSIPIQFMLNWIELIINSNSIHELIQALTWTAFEVWVWMSNYMAVDLWMQLLYPCSNLRQTMLVKGAPCVYTDRHSWWFGIKQIGPCLAIFLGDEMRERHACRLLDTINDCVGGYQLRC